jgi:hypothetical protein
MDEIQELIEQTECLQSQVETLQHSVKELQCQLAIHSDALYAKLAQVNGQDEAFVGQSAVLECNGLAGEQPWSYSHEAGDDANRRLTPRRRGNPVPIQISQSETSAEVFRGWVIDRSPEGLCLITEKSVTVGSQLNVRPVHHLASPSWYQVEVRNCRPERELWVVGCQFAQKLSWTDMRLFS